MYAGYELGSMRPWWAREVCRVASSPLKVTGSYYLRHKKFLFVYLFITLSELFFSRTSASLKRVHAYIHTCIHTYIPWSIPRSPTHSSLHQMLGKPFKVPFAHSKQITALATMRKGPKLILVSASETRACVSACVSE